MSLSLRSCVQVAAPTAMLAVVLLPCVGCSNTPSKPTRQIRSPGREELATTATARTPRTLGPVALASFEQDLPTPRSVPLRPLVYLTEQETAADALARIGQPAIPALLEALQSPDPDVRAKAAHVLGRMGPDAAGAVPELARLLADPDERVRKTAVQALGRIGPAAQEAVPALMRSLLQPSPQPPTG